MKIHVVDLHVLFLEFLVTQRLFIKLDKVWIPKVKKIKDLLTMATFLENLLGERLNEDLLCTLHHGYL